MSLNAGCINSRVRGWHIMQPQACIGLQVQGQFGRVLLIQQASGLIATT